ncbi:uncharacterized protein KY384_008471 [Bacidia gigantensis]|uniref:uncharacterized protein n=1 Tax=Bacidia gigantensis TaxID=2732470 RepID=UPI001D05291C|nr:uncharacterized protein KY384_008471 [Bacidia gigantensis]KAG8527042.1 hypothetical protein KY384_008471 [Bacidia gigantensis]
MANETLGRGACTAPFLQLSEFPSKYGYHQSRFCAPVPSLEGPIDCCLPCPITDWVYSDEFDVIPEAANWLNVAGMVCSISLLVTYLALPAKQTSRHYLNVGLVSAICLMQLGFIIPLGSKPEQCHDGITPNDMYSDMTCAFSGAFLLFGGFCSIMWGFLRSVSIHLQICWKRDLGDKFFWISLFAGWGVPALIVSVTLPLTGTSYRFGSTCHINHPKALEDYWGPLLAFAAISTILQFSTFGYIIKVYVTSLLEDNPANSSTNVSSGGLPSYNSRAGSVKTLTAAQAFRRIKKVIALQWRGTAIVVIIVVNVVFLAIVFVQMDNTVTGAVNHLERAQPWLLCLVLNDGDKNKCLDKVKDAKLVTSEPTVMAVLVLLSLNGIWSILFLGRTTMIIGWADILRGPFHRKPTDFVSVDARRFSADPKQYEMIMSPPSRPYSLPKEPESVVTSPPVDEKDGLFAIPQSPTSHYSRDYFDNKEVRTSKDTQPYSTPRLSFSTPRPPSAGRMNSMNSRSFSPQLSTIPTSRSASRTAQHTATMEWDPTSTHAKSMR